MANMTLSMPDEIQIEMKKFPEIRWSEVARKAIIEKLNASQKLELMDKLLAKSKFTQKDANELAKKVNAAASKRFRELAKKQGYL